MGNGQLAMAEAIGTAGDGLKPASTAARALASAAAGGVMATCAVGIYLGLAGAGHTAWFVAAFEVVALVGALFALGVGLGKFAWAPGLALLCVAGAVGAGTFLAHIGSGRQVLPSWFLVARGGLTLALVAAAALSVLSRNPGAATRSLVRAAMFGVPLVAILGGAWVMRNQALALPGAAKLGAGFVVFLIVTGLAAGAVHCAIRAFEVCDEDPGLR